jgi:hypothetical protein
LARTQVELLTVTDVAASAGIAVTLCGARWPSRFAQSLQIYRVPLRQASSLPSITGNGLLQEAQRVGAPLARNREVIGGLAKFLCPA